MTAVMTVDKMLRKRAHHAILLSVPQARAGMMVTPNIRLLRALGEGGMGAVWVADHLALHTQVVVKFIASDLEHSAEAQDRFSREAAAASQVKSPHVVQTFDHGISDDGTPYIVMELLEGRDLGETLEAHGKLEPHIVVEILAQLARALDRAHERGIVHRDIKPGNIFLCEQGGGEIFVKLLDFGIAKGVEMAISKVDSNTKTGSMIGSPFYMSPEQILGSKDLDRRSDLWSVGIVAFEALTGAKPFDAETMGGLAIRIHSDPLPLPSAIDSTLDPAVDAWFLRACSRKIDERFTSTKEMAESLARAVGGEMPKSLEPPRMSTGPRRSTPKAAELTAGAATDAGVVRTTSPSKTRGRVLALLAILIIGAPASFFAIRAALHKDPGAGLTAEPRTAPEKSMAASQPSAPVSTTPVVPTDTTPPPPQPGTNVATAATPTTPIKVVGVGHGAKPRPKESATPPSTSLPSQPPPPSTTPRPATSGHDIF